MVAPEHFECIRITHKKNRRNQGRPGLHRLQHRVRQFILIVHQAPDKLTTWPDEVMMRNDLRKAVPKMPQKLRNDNESA